MLCDGGAFTVPSPKMAAMNGKYSSVVTATVFLLRHINVHAKAYRQIRIFSMLHQGNPVLGLKSMLNGETHLKVLNQGPVSSIKSDRPAATKTMGTFSSNFI